MLSSHAFIFQMLAPTDLLNRSLLVGIIVTSSIGPFFKAKGLFFDPHFMIRPK